MWEDMPTIDVEEGTTIEHEQIGFIGHNYGGYPEDVYYEKITKEDIQFILDNEVDCEIEMIDEFLGSGESSDELLFEGELIPKLHKGKVIIYLK
jgi:hypothetical protein